MLWYCKFQVWALKKIYVKEFNSLQQTITFLTLISLQVDCENL